MLPFQLAATLLLLAVCSFAPGFFLLRRVHWTAMEKLCGSVALSLILIWLAAWGLYIAGAPPAAAYAVSAISLALAAVSFHDLRRLLTVVRVRQALLGLAALLAWTLLAVCIIRVYSAAGWIGDWLEHFQRTLFFAHRFPTNTPIFGGYLLPARPPAQNVIASLFMNQTGDAFENFQTIFAFLNVLVFLPCCLALPLLARSRKFRILPLLVLFAANPVVMQNATYTWTKLLTVFYVILAIFLYLRGWQRNDTSRTVAAFLCLAMGMLVHYSAGPYIVILGLHYLFVVFPKRRDKIRELALIAATCGILLSTWFGWSLAVYGVKATAASNTSVTSSQLVPGSNLQKIALNIIDTFVPRWMADPRLSHIYDQPNDLAALRDKLFLNYQVQLLFTMGLIGGPLVVWLLYRGFRRAPAPAPLRHFWIWLILVAIILGIAVVGERDPFGSAHLTLLPIELLGLTLLAARFRTSRILALLITAGCVLDFSLGVFLHLRVQHLENTGSHVYFTSPAIISGQFILRPTLESLSDRARENWFRKHELANARRWTREVENADVQGKPEIMKILGDMLSDDPTYFRGWYARHNGEVTFLGDHFGDSDIPSGLMLLAFAGLIWKLSQAFPKAATTMAVTAKSKPVRARRKA